MTPELHTTILHLSETLAYRAKELQSCAKAIRALAFPNAAPSIQSIHSTIPALVQPTRKRKANDDYEAAQANKDRTKRRSKAYTDATSAVPVTQTSPIKKLDPCARFPTEIWHHVLSCYRFFGLHGLAARLSGVAALEKDLPQEPVWGAKKKI
ncbi:hypothetical protein BG011_009731 [Mortierella polycephala]|uniref:Uncharacterized protein n=1 Tax=Mortierella polycephala TaxID=41804 RepID=A0A9P6PMV2_9FUNG|nr:hypothetical protein BG011_009731 [Mortierella polycephala]